MERYDGPPDYCDTCDRQMYGFTRDANGALICRTCQIVADGFLVCDECEGTGFQEREVGEPCYPCAATGRRAKIIF